MPLKIVYPEPNSTMHENQTFLLGTIGAQESLKINHQKVLLGAKGGFAHVVTLHPGRNEFELEVSQGKATPEKTTLVIFKSTPLQPPQQGFAKELCPWREPGVAMPGEVIPLYTLVAPSIKKLLVQIKTVDGKLVTQARLAPYSLLHPQNPSGWVDTQEAVFAELHQTSRPISATGYWSGGISLPDSIKDGTPYKIYLCAEDVGGKLYDWCLPGVLVGWLQPRLGQIGPNPATLRSHPVSGARQGQLLAGTWVSVIGHQHGWYQIKLGAQGIFWLEEKDITLHGPLNLLPEVVRTMHLESKSGKTCINLPLDRPIPFTIRAEEDRVNLRLFGVNDSLDFVHSQTPESHRIHLKKELLDAETLLVSVKADNKIAGYKACAEEAGLKIELHHLPQRFEDWVIVLDPGHGGKETGAKALDGTPEKTLNLAIALELQTALKKLGFKWVDLTRTSDYDLSLEERQVLVEEAGAHVCLSLHFNALPDGRDPWKAIGASTYYYQSFAKPLAERLQAALTNEAARPDYGLLYDSLAMTRMSGCIGLLLEFGFIIHPTEWVEMLSSTEHKKMAQAVANALKAYALSLSS